ncbi:hypothetical protein PGT21_019790 [Puccinia graminis f. sp. tritici]|uniref:No apical meristem-associated C-terminal domain-containing protein n=1 Tax=Puccinia graminis f. sp. tritici TaxID=56615 RepID=A0A5B0P0X1_PUCGR|nr:hypothetical protein PGTUg99_010468 [Puccinia graminis f. sp. tritici]KAA1094384.1 hypothetical protein PGT21_019790 [Puccinia graminis f. sp. tritici]
MDAREAYYKQVGKNFLYNQPWNLLRHVPKFKILGGKANNGRASGPPNNNQSSASLNPGISQSDSQPASDNVSQPTTQASNGGSTNSKDWERPTGIHNTKCQEADNLYRRKKMKLLEYSHNESIKQTAEVKRGNDIQAELVAIDRAKTNLNCMLQNLDDCPDDLVRKYLASEKQRIMEERQLATKKSSSSRPQPSLEEDSKSDEDNNGDMTQTQNLTIQASNQELPIDPLLPHI